MTRQQYTAKKRELEKIIREAQSEIGDMQHEYIKEHRRFFEGDKVRSIKLGGLSHFIEGVCKEEHGFIFYDISDPTLRGERRKFPIITGTMREDLINRVD